jgi:hypothetical protein
VRLEIPARRTTQLPPRPPSQRPRCTIATFLKHSGSRVGTQKNVVAPTLKTILARRIHKNLHRTTFQRYHHVAIREHGMKEIVLEKRCWLTLTFMTFQYTPRHHWQLTTNCGIGLKGEVKTEILCSNQENTDSALVLERLNTI